jgi:hypothetical protein
MIGHALAPARPRPSAVDWDRWIAAGFAIGSACFFVGPFPGFVQAVGQGADSAVFFAGSIFFTVAAALERTALRGRLLVERGDPVRRHPVVQRQHLPRPADWAIHARAEQARLGAGPVRVRVLSGLGGACLRRNHRAACAAGTMAPESARPRVGYGRRQPGRMRAVRRLGDRLLRRAVNRVGARPGTRQLGHRAGSAVLPDRRSLARVGAAPRGSPSCSTLGVGFTRGGSRVEASRAHESPARDTGRAMSEEKVEQLHRARAEWAR